MRKANASPVTMLLSNLFQGDTVRLEPHLGFAGTACVRLDFKGLELQVKPSLMILRDGKFQDILISQLSMPVSGEFTFSLKEISRRDGQITYRAVMARNVFAVTTGPSSWAYEFSLPEHKKGHTMTTFGSHFNQVAAPIDLNKSIETWALYASESIPKADYLQGESRSLVELVMRSEWGLVLKLSVDRSR